MKILIAEDEENIAKGIASMLKPQKQYKCQIRFAGNGQEALEIAEEFRPDLVITDIRMFHMTGLELAEALNERKICSNVIIVSGYSTFDYAQKAIRANVMDYLVKPVDRQHLLALVDKVWKELPAKYVTPANGGLLEYEFFSLDLDSEDYPGSLQKAIRFLRKNYMLDMSLQILSEELMMHPNYISTLIAKHTQRNFSYLLDYIRLEKACELLVSAPDLTISEVSYLVGYNNERRLYNAFQKRLSCTPKDFKLNALSHT